MSIGSRAKAGILVAALVVLAVEGILLVRYYDRHYGLEAASDTAAGSPAAFEGTVPEATMPEATMPEGTALGGGTASRGDTPSDAEEVSFVHRATDANSRGDYTVLDHAGINGEPDAVVLAEPDGSYERNIGVWYVPEKNKWAIFNQDLAAVPAEAAFEVTVPPADQGLVHRAGPADTFGNATYLDDPLLNGRPDAAVSVTQNWNPGGGSGVYNDHPVGVLYDEDVSRWFVYNEDGARVPEGAAFNVAVSGKTG